jgi:hypothetical protein
MLEAASPPASPAEARVDLAQRVRRWGGAPPPELLRRLVDAAA